MAQQNLQTDILDPGPNSLSQTGIEIAAHHLKLGISSFNAYYLEENCSTAFKWFKLSAEQGNMEAQFRLAELYSLGMGIPKSHTDAYKWYTKAAIQGYKKASIRIHNLYQEDIRMLCRGRLNSQEKLREKPRKDEYIEYDLYSEYDIYKKDKKHYKKKINYSSLVLNKPQLDNMNDKDEKPEHYYRELYEQRLDDHKLELNHAIEYYTVQFKIYKSSDQEDPEVQQNLGFLYQHGYGVKTYDKWAIEYYTKAAEKGYVDSQYQLGYLYQKNTDIKFNYKKAYHWYYLAANGGNVAAQNHLGYFYEKGLGTNVDYTQALYWYIRAAEFGHSMAQLTLGKWYRKGCYVDLDYSMAVKWYTLAARQGNSVAQNCLVQLYQKEKICDTTYESDILCYSKQGSKEGRLCSKLQADILKINDPLLVENIKKLAKRALMGDGNAMYEVGLKYYNGTDFNENKLIGFKWIKNAVYAGHKDAVFKVTQMYDEGDTVQQDFHKVAIWTKKLAKKKNDIAQCNLGILYKEGRGVRRDPLEASRWFTLSADQGNSEAQYQLGCLRQTGVGLRKDEEEALKWFDLLAKKGDINGCYALGVENFDENRSKIDETTALRLLEYSAKCGNENAQYEMWIHYSKFYDKSNADFYFDMLSFSKNAYIINRTLIYSMSDEDFDINYIKYFNYLKQAANLGNPIAKEVFRTPHTNIIEEFLERMFSMCTLISEEGILSMEYNIGYLVETDLNFNGDDYDDDDDNRLNSLMLQLYSNSAKKGDSRAQARLGIIHEEGRGVKLNIGEAINYYNLAYREGNQDAMYRLACLYLDGRGVSQDLEKAFELFTQASDMGHIEARKVLMLPYCILDEYSPECLYYNQLVVEINNVNQIKMLEKMAESGLVAIQYQLGDFYENRDNSKAVHWFTLAAHGGVTEACYRLGVLYGEGKGTKKDYSQSIGYFETAIINKHEGAMYQLAEIYLDGKGVKINYSKAYQLYQKAAEMGHELSCRILGINYAPASDRIINCPSSEEVAVSFDSSLNEFRHVLLMFQHVAKEGDVELQYRLGVIYESIFDMPNYEEAVKWYSMAANNSHKEAMCRLGSLYEAGNGATQDYQKAMQLYTQAHELGSYDALYRLGTIYHHGTAVDTDYKKAVRLYKEAANNGHLESQHTLGKLYEEGSLIKRNLLNSLKWYTQAYLKGYDPARTDLYAMYNDLPYEKYFFNRLNHFLLSIFKKFELFGLEKFDHNYGSIFYRLGIQHLYGNGIPQDYKESLKCFKLASEKFKNSAAQDVLNMKYSGDRNLFLKVVDMYETLFATLESSQQYSLAMLYYNGVVNTTKNIVEKSKQAGNKNTSTCLDEGCDNQDVILATDYKKTISLLKKNQGNYHDEAHIQLAKMYTYGHGVEKSIEKAIEHYIKASNDQTNYYAFEIAQIYHFDDSFCNFSKAIEWYEKADVRKKGAALNILGLIYKNGDGINQDYEKSLRYFKESATISPGGDDKYPHYNFGLMYYYGYGTEKNYDEAFNYFKKATVYGHVMAQTYLANMYLNGYGVEKNINKAKKIYKRAFNNTCDNKSTGIADVTEFMYDSEAIEWLKKIENSDPIISLEEIDFSDVGEGSMEPSKNCTGYQDIWYSIGKMYYKGNGVQIDYHQAYTYFMKAAEAGHSKAQKKIVKMHNHAHDVGKDIEKAIDWYIKAAENGSDYVAISLGELYHYNDQIQDFSKAFDWYQKAPEDNNKSYALRGIGLLFEYGDGVTQDYEKSVEYYQQSADLQNTGGFYNLALMYYYGKGVDQDYKKCFDLLNDSIKEEPVKGNTHVFVQIEGNLSTNTADSNRVYSLEDETILYGEVYFQLGIMHKHGQGTPQDDSRAKECFSKAIEYGNEQAKDQMK